MRARLGILFCIMTLVFSAAGCATAPKPRTVEKSFTYDNGYDAVWSAVVSVFAELNLPIANMEKDSGLITTDWIGFDGTKNDDYCDCGGAGITVEVSRKGRFNVFVKSLADGATSLQVNTTYQAVRTFGDAASTIQCYSTGSLEAKISDMVTDKLKT